MSRNEKSWHGIFAVLIATFFAGVPVGQLLDFSPFLVFVSAVAIPILYGPRPPASLSPFFE